MDISELTPKQQRFWNAMKESHQPEDFSQLQSQLREDKSLSDFCSSALIQCAKEGDQNAVRMLLAVGATLNREDEWGKYCDAFLSAAVRGRLEVVKLLVERGADLTAENGRGSNAMMLAEFCGQDEVAKYLRSLGMIDLEMNRVYDFESAHETILERISDSQGEPSSWHVELPGNPQIVIRHIPVQSGHRGDNGQVLFTVGLSDHRLPCGRHKRHFIELMMNLRPDWSLSPESLSQAEWNWPIEWMKRIAIQLRTADQIYESQMFFNGSPPQPLGPNTRLCGWVGEEYDDGGVTYDVEGHKTVYTLMLFPIHEDEMSIIERDGVGEFTRRLYVQAERQAKSSFRIIDPSRPSVAGDDCA